MGAQSQFSQEKDQGAPVAFASSMGIIVFIRSLLALAWSELSSSSVIVIDNLSVKIKWYQGSERASKRARFDEPAERIKANSLNLSTLDNRFRPRFTDHPNAYFLRIIFYLFFFHSEYSFPSFPNHAQTKL